MRWFLSGRIPDATRILLVESGSRSVLESALAKMRGVFPNARFDLCTCYSGLPTVVPATPMERVWRVGDAVSIVDKLRMVRAMARSRPPVAALLFSGERILFNWKVLLLLALPSKMLLVNENGDFFWLDRVHLSVLRQFMGARWGMNSEGLAWAVVRLATFPFVLVFLALYAVAGYSLRWSRLAWWKITDDRSASR